MSFSRTLADVGSFRLGKLWELLSLTLRSIAILRREPSVLYYPPAPPALVPVLRDLIYLTLVRPFAHATVFHFHAGGVGAFVAARPWLRWLSRRAYGEPDIAVQIGPSSPADGERFGARQIATVPYGIPEPPVLPAPASTDTLRLLFVGMHTESKGIDTVLEVADRLRKRGVDFRIHLVGEWPDAGERARFELRRRELDLTSVVSPRGLLEGAAKWREFAEAHMLLFPTRYPAETLGIVVLEAMAAAIPTVASRWPGPCDVIEDSRTGLLCPPADAEAFAQAIEGLWRDARRRDAMGAAARERFLEHYTEARYLEAMERMLRRAAQLDSDSFDSDSSQSARDRHVGGGAEPTREPE